MTIDSLKSTLKTKHAENFFSLVLLQGAGYLLPLITYPYLFRVLGVEYYGLVMFAYAVTQYLIMVTDFGFNLSATRFISEHRNNRELINRYLNSAMLCRLGLFLLSMAIITVLVLFIPRFEQQKLLFLLFGGMILGNVLFPAWFFQGMEQMKYITLINVSARILSIVPFFFFVHGPDDYLWVPVFYGSGYILAGFLSVWSIYRSMKMRWFVRGIVPMQEVMKESGAYFLSRISTSMFTTINTVILGLVCGNTAVGYYSIGEKLYQAYNSLLAPVTGVLFPHMTHSKNVLLFKRVFRTITIGNIVCVTIALLLAPLIVQLLFASSEPESIDVFRILLLACYVTIPSMMLGYPFLAALGHPNFTNYSLVLVSVLHVTGIFLLYLFSSISVYSIALMVLFTEGLLMLFRGMGVRHYKLFSR